jgi:hypothetical protein
MQGQCLNPILELRVEKGALFSQRHVRDTQRLDLVEEQRALHVPGAAMRASSPLALPRR